MSTPNPKGPQQHHRFFPFCAWHLSRNLSHNPLSGGLDFFLDIHPAPSNSNNKVMDYYRIDVNSCNFSGPFPSFSGDSYLHEIFVANNSFTGPFPSHILHPELTDLDLSANHFSGPLPPIDSDSMGYGFLTNLNVSHNHFTGVVPLGFWKLYSTKTL
ncbi:hypothetical protein CLOM_g18371 [Closterium sp. NIES-68]|nr:hypothetical protein CLOM_g18371 [Closterium sp. NIES-68]GJP80836.1 hypothetical protein CLOP_g11032 [Closterium sp. NIES-67]